jgi:hypothetical protein
MEWSPISRAELASLVEAQLRDCPDEAAVLFRECAITPEKWSQSPWGNLGGGFWAVAVCGERVLWYNDIEDGFNVSRFDQRGIIPDDEYWCNQDPLKWALPRLVRAGGLNAGPPERLS